MHSYRETIARCRRDVLVAREAVRARYASALIALVFFVLGFSVGFLLILAGAL